MGTDRTYDFNYRKSNSQVADVAEEEAVAVVPLVCSLESLHNVADSDSIFKYPFLERDYVQRLALFIANRLKRSSVCGSGKVCGEHATCVPIQTS